MVRKPLLLIVLLFVVGLVGLQAQQVVRYQYWTDSSSDRHTVLNQNGSELSLSLSLASQSTGLHVFNFRAQDNVGEWSPVNRMLYYVSESPEPVLSVKKIEYWTDDFYSQRRQLNTTSSQVSFSLSLSGQSPGVHVLHVRRQDTNDQWSPVNRMLYYVSEAAESQPSAKQLQYWIDSDFAKRTNVPLSSAVVNLSIPIGMQTAGVHVLNVRTQDSSGLWSHVERLLYYIEEPQADDEAQVDADGNPIVTDYYEYWIDDDYSGRIRKSGQVADNLVLQNINVSYLEDGTHYLYLRARKSNGRWGSVNKIPFELTGLSGYKPFDFDGTIKAYAVLGDEGLTFYYDKEYADKTGSLFAVANSYSLDQGLPDWYYVRSRVNKVTFDVSFSRYAPISTAYWFYGLGNLSEIEGIEWLDTRNVTDMCSMFAGCGSLQRVIVSDFVTKNVKDFSRMFSGCVMVDSIDVSCFDTRNATSLSAMFDECSSLTTIDVSGFLTAKVTNMASMFRKCSSLTSLYLGSFTTNKVTDLRSMFSGCTRLKTIYARDNWDMGKVTESKDMFLDCTSLVGGKGTTYNQLHTAHSYAWIDGDQGNPGYFTYWSMGDDNGKAYAVLYEGTLTFYYDDNRRSRKGVVYSVKDDTPYWIYDRHRIEKARIDSTFVDYYPTSTANWFYNCDNLTTVDGLQYLRTDSVTTMKEMFRFCGSLTSLDVSHFNTKKVIDMGCMFCYCSSLTSLDVSHFETENVINMEHMFHTCPVTVLNLRNFNTAKVVDMNTMFCACQNLRTIYASKLWSKDNVTVSSAMFTGCSQLVGGCGTKFNPRYTDKTYALIDEGVTNPGYLTDETLIPVPVVNYSLVEWSQKGDEEEHPFVKDPKLTMVDGNFVVKTNERTVNYLFDNVKEFTLSKEIIMPVSDFPIPDMDADEFSDAGIIVVKKDGTRMKIHIDSLINMVPYKEQTVVPFRPGKIEAYRGHQYVDLGVSIAWADCNIGAEQPEGKGSYFSWGETSPKAVYNESTYKFGYPPTKYTTEDGLKELLPEDDAACVTWGGTWRMPSRAEEEELYAKCTWSWENVNGVDGFRVTGPNGNSIFLPTTGLYDGDSTNKLKRGDTGGWYWSTTSRGDSYACGICFPSPNYLYQNVPNHERWDGHAIRPVLSELEIEVRGIVINLKHDKTIKISEEELNCILTYPRSDCEDFVIGDVNADSKVDLADAKCIVNHLLGIPNASFLAAAADVNNDGQVTIADAVQIVNFVVGNIPSMAPCLDGKMQEPE